jgi:CRISPR/Cas system-associated exonuclease Cas4 (RecB family)
MIIGLPGKPQKGNLSNVGHLCLQAVEAGDFSLFGTVNKLETTIDESGFVFGELNTKKVPRVDEDSDWTINSYPVNLRKDSIRLRLKSRDYFLKSESDVHSHLDFGNIMHEIFSRIHTMQDIEQAVNSFYNDGLLGERDADRLKTLIREKIERMELIDWYQEGSEILNERDIFEGGETFRPDRVMINDGNAIVLDYKFGDEENQGHIRQVRKYMRLLNQMNYRSVKGYLWYVMQNDLIEVL